MKPIRAMLMSTAAFGLQVGVCAAQGGGRDDLEAIITDLRIENRSLQEALVSANRAEKQASEQLASVRATLDALGGGLLDGGEQDLVDAQADNKVLRERIARLESVASNLSGVITDYLRQAVASDPDARLRVETAMRELDEVLGLRHKPAPTAQTSGSASRAKVMSIDAESGLLVLNIGERQQTRIGTTYRLLRGDQPYGTAIIADVRSSISGAFVETLESGSDSVRVGDSAILEIE